MCFASHKREEARCPENKAMTQEQGESYSQDDQKS